MGTTLIVKTQFTAVDKFTSVVKKMTAATKGFANKAVVAFNRVERAERKLRRGISKTVGKLGLVVGFALVSQAALSTINVFATFEQANANLASVMSTATGPQLKALQDDAKRLGSITAKTATEVVGLQEAFARLGFETPDIIAMTQATISGSIAMQGELSATAELVGAMVKSFDAFESIDAPDIIDKMTLATQKSALNFEKLQTALPIVSGAANAAGIPFTKLLALLGKLSDAGIDASSSSTALRNIFLESAKQGLNYDQILDKIVKSQNKLTVANDEFGKRGAVSSVILAKNLKQTAELDKVLQNAAGTAEIAANKQLNTLTGRLTLLGSAWEGFILSVEDGNGSFGEFLKTAVSVVTEILSMASGTAKAEDSLTKAEFRIRSIANTAVVWLKILKVIVIIMFSLKVAMVAINLAMTAYKIGAMAVTAAQWLWNTSMFAATIPIGIVIIAIIAMIAIITIVIVKWNEWGAAIAVGMGPLGMIISLIQSFRRNWELIQKAFSEGGILAGLKAIGAVILDALLMPLEQVLLLASKIPGLGDRISPALEGLAKFRENLGVNVSTDESGNALNPDATIEKVRTERTEKTNNAKVGIDINDKSGLAEIVKNTGANINLTQTLGWQG